MSEKRFGGKCCGELLSLAEKCVREALDRKFAEKCCREMLEKSVGE